jgi:hypothetical protein
VYAVTFAAARTSGPAEPRPAAPPPTAAAPPSSSAAPPKASCSAAATSSPVPRQRPATPRSAASCRSTLKPALTRAPSALRATSASAVRKTGFVVPSYTKTRSFYQDRLGTNTRKALKREGFFTGAADSPWSGNLNQEAPNAIQPTFLCASRDHEAAAAISELVRHTQIAVARLLCAVLCCAVLCCAVLCCAVLCYLLRGSLKSNSAAV